jgi:hypothetical protein
MGQNLALLPATQSLFNLRAVRVNRFSEIWDRCTVYVARKNDDKLVFLSSCGPLGDDFVIGKVHYAIHDQTRKMMSRVEIVNVINIQGGKIVSHENNQGLHTAHPIWVFK